MIQPSIATADRAPSPSGFLLLSSLDTIGEVLAVENDLTRPFLGELQAVLEDVGVPLRTVSGSIEAEDVWIQDAVEIGCWYWRDGRNLRTAPAILPGIRAQHDGIHAGPLDAIVRATLEELGIRVAIEVDARPGTRWIDWYGNLEVSPPVRSRSGVTFPCGRVLTGRQHDLGIHPAVLDFLESTGVQTPPLILDTSWLLIGHVDEVVGFVPASAGGFKAIVPSPARARDVLQAAADSGHAGVVLRGTADETSVADLLNDGALWRESAAIDDAMAGNIELLGEGLGLKPSEIIALPALFRNGRSLLPNPVNSLICADRMICPSQGGPVMDGKDRVEADIESQVAPIGVRVHFVDAFEPFHANAGEIHCGTNAIRTPSPACLAYLEANVPDEAPSGQY